MDCDDLTPEECHETLKHVTSADPVKLEPDPELMVPMYPPQQWWVPVIIIGVALVAALVVTLAWEHWA